MLDKQASLFHSPSGKTLKTNISKTVSLRALFLLFLIKNQVAFIPDLYLLISITPTNPNKNNQSTHLVKNKTH